LDVLASNRHIARHSGEGTVFQVLDLLQALFTREQGPDEPSDREQREEQGDYSYPGATPEGPYVTFRQVGWGVFIVDIPARFPAASHRTLLSHDATWAPSRLAPTDRPTVHNA
jgi:hypothetical protein